MQIVLNVHILQALTYLFTIKVEGCRNAICNLVHSEHWLNAIYACQAENIWLLKDKDSSGSDFFSIKKW